MQLHLMKTQFEDQKRSFVPKLVNKVKQHQSEMIEIIILNRLNNIAFSVSQMQLPADDPIHCL